jgi:hypothetical protein
VQLYSGISYSRQGSGIELEEVGQLAGIVQLVGDKLLRIDFGVRYSQVSWGRPVSGLSLGHTQGDF